MRPRFFAAFVLALAFCLRPLVAQQGASNTPQPPVTFKAEIDYVDVDAIVTDQQGNFISDLKAADFEVFEDGKPQKIDMFSFVDLPIDRRQIQMGGSRLLPTDVRSNQQAGAGRLYVIVLDDLDTSFFRTTTVRLSARRFVERYLGENDVAAVVYTSGRSDAAQDFTSDPSLLLAAIDKFVGRKLRSATLDKIDSYFRQLEAKTLDAAGRDASGPAAPTNNSSLSAGSSTDPSINPFTRGDGYPDRTFDSDDLERGFRALRVLEGLKDISDFLANVQGRRKALLLFSEGVDYEMDNIFGAQEATQVVRATQDAITAAARANVTVFGVDPRGLVGMSSDAVALSSSAGTVNDAPTAASNFSGFAAEIRLSQDSLRSLSEETGGFASLTNDPTATFERIVRANSRYYVLGYYPPSHPRDGGFHRIEVRVKRPGLRVSARKGYASPRGKTPEERAKDEAARLAREANKGGVDTTSAELRSVLNSPMQQGGVAMLVHAAPFRAAVREHSVALAIEMVGAPFKFQPANNGTVMTDKLEVSYFSMNEQGKPLRGERHELELSLRNDTYERARQTGFRLNERIALAPGRYQIRIGVRESGTGALGTLFYDLQIPDFSNLPLSMSGILLTAGTSPIVPTLMADKQVTAEQLPGPATSRRVFAQGDELALYSEVYDNLRQNHSVAIGASLTGEDGREVFASRESRDLQPQGNAGTSTLGIAKRISLKDVRPGSYMLRVEARASGGGSNIKPVTSETPVTVIASPAK